MNGTRRGFLWIDSTFWTDSCLSNYIVQACSIYILTNTTDPVYDTMKVYGLWKQDIVEGNGTGGTADTTNGFTFTHFDRANYKNWGGIGCTVQASVASGAFNLTDSSGHDISDTANPLGILILNAATTWCIADIDTDFVNKCLTNKKDLGFKIGPGGANMSTVGPRTKESGFYPYFVLVYTETDTFSTVLRPTGAGNYTAWAQSNGEAAEYANVNDVITNEDLDFIKTATTDARSSYTLSDKIPAYHIIDSVKMTARVRYTGSTGSAVSFFLRIGETDADNYSDVIEVTSSWTDYTYSMSPPGGGAWSARTGTTADSLEAGVFYYAGGAFQQAEVTQLYVTVYSHTGDAQVIIVGDK